MKLLRCAHTRRVTLSRPPRRAADRAVLPSVEPNSDQQAALSQIVQSVAESHLLGGLRRYNRQEVAQRSGVPADLARKLWVALGFPAGRDDESAEFTDADVAAVREFTKLSVVAGTDLQLQLSAARTLGQAMSRLAEWQVDLVTEEIISRIGAADGGEPVSDIASAATEQTVAVLADLQTYTWRRHLAAALDRSLNAGPAMTGGPVRSLAVGFADMVGYTRLTRHLDPDELTELLEVFETTTTEAITEQGGWVIKNVGDEVMFAAEHPADGARIGLAIQERITAAAATVAEMPQLRVGIAYGQVLQRFGDLYGSVVNIAARLTGVARPGTVLIDDGAAAELADDPAFSLRHLRGVRVRGFNRLRSHVLRHNNRARP
jgi:adenylate cyclase